MSSSTTTTTKPMPSQQELRNAFVAVYDDLKNFLLSESRQYELPEHHVQYIARVCTQSNLSMSPTYNISKNSKNFNFFTHTHFIQQTIQQTIQYNT